jgi:molybdenum cofactor cytidylyltransferase
MTPEDISHSLPPGARIAAVVLAAGLSSRMGRPKPLLPFGTEPAIARVVGSLRAAGVNEITVVTGHEAGALAPVLEGLGVSQAHNPGYESGMFSSVRTGVAALRVVAEHAHLDAFVVLPVDCPLVTPRVLQAVIERFDTTGKGIVYPTCFGRRGHPPLLSARYIGPLLQTDPAGNLQEFLLNFADDETEVEVLDLTTLMDMDTPEEYVSLKRFAEVLDTSASSLPEPSLTEEEALFLLAAAGTPGKVVGHCRTAAAVGLRVAEALRPHLPGLDVSLVRAGCLLHDVARLVPHHARVAAGALTNLGLPRLGAVVGEHMVIDPALPRSPGITEAELVYLADKTVADGEVVGLEERQARTLRKMRPSPETALKIRARIEEARMIAAKAEGILGHPVQELLDEVVVPEEIRQAGPRIYLVRHASPETPAEQRYRGQADVPLGRQGEEQARHLAGKLMDLTGGACFDAAYSSDLHRSRRTAEIAVAGCGTPVRSETWLREIDTGLWEGLSREEARRGYPKEHAERERDLVGVRFPGGESFAELDRRVVAGFEALVAESVAAGCRRVLVVGHKGVNRVILAHFRGLPLADIFSLEQDYCAVTVLKVTAGEAGTWKVTSIQAR